MEENGSQTDTGCMEEDSEGTLTAFIKVRLTTLKFSSMVSSGLQETIITIFTCRVELFTKEVFWYEFVHAHTTHTDGEWWRILGLFLYI